MEYFTVGKIINTVGIKGEVKVRSITDFPESRFKVGNTLVSFSKSGNKNLIIDKAREHKGFIILHFKGYNSINDVTFLKPSELKVAASDLPEKELKEGEFYYHQIIGLQVEDENRRKLGTIKEIMSLGPNDVWVVQRDDKPDLLLPKIDSVIKKVDLKNQKVEVNLMKGLE